MKLGKLLRDPLLSSEGCRDETGILGRGSRSSKGLEKAALDLSCGGWPALEVGLSVCWGQMEFLGEMALRGSWPNTLKDQAKEYRLAPEGTGEPVNVVEQGNGGLRTMAQRANSAARTF